MGQGCSGKSNGQVKTPPSTRPMTQVQKAEDVPKLPTTSEERAEKPTLLQDSGIMSTEGKGEKASELGPAESMISSGEPVYKVGSTTSTAITMKFPMWVVPVKDARKMTEVIAHQDLQEKGILVEWEEGMGPVLFVSHQWVGGGHPDPKFEQFGVLKQVFDNMEECLKKKGKEKTTSFDWTIEGDVIVAFYNLGRGKGRVQMSLEDMKRYLEHGYIWYDYFSVPQPGARPNDPTVIPKLMAAVYSIPAYVEKATEFIILVPAVRHVIRKGETCDYTSWQGRGWCRVELFARALTQPTKLNIRVASSEVVEYIFGGKEWVNRNVGTGQFTVESDKALLGPVIEQLLNFKIKEMKDANRIWELRWFLARRDPFLHGLGDYPSYSEKFIEDCGFKDFLKPDYPMMCGYNALHFACLEGSPSVVKELLDKKADPNGLTGKMIALERACGSNYMMDDFTPPLILACLFGTHPSIVETVHLLIDRKADVNCTTVAKRSPLFFSAGGGFTEMTVALLERKGDPNHRDFTGIVPISHCTTFASGTRSNECLRLLVDAKADINSYFKPGASLFCDVLMFGKYFMFDTFLELKADIEQPIKMWGAGKLLKWYSKIGKRIGWKNDLWVQLYDVLSDGARPIHVCAWFGQGECMARLLEAKVDHTTKASNGWMTALDVAELRKNKLCIKLLKEAAGDVDDKNMGVHSMELEPKEQCADWAELVKMNSADEGKEFDEDKD